jgi:hypothetical protein
MNKIENDIIIDFKNFLSIEDIVNKHIDIGLSVHIVKQIIKSNNLIRDRPSKMLKIFGNNKKHNNVKILNTNIPKVPIVNVTRQPININKILENANDAIKKCDESTNRKKIKSVIK